MWGETSLGFWFAIPWWLVMLRIYSYTCWQFEYVQWKISIHIFAHGISTVLLLSCFWFCWPLCFVLILSNYNISGTSQVSTLQILHPIINTVRIDIIMPWGFVSGNVYKWVYVFKWAWLYGENAYRKKESSSIVFSFL